MSKEPNGSAVEEHYDNLGVRVIIPPQDSGKILVIKGPLPYPFLVNKSPEPKRFELIRLVINFRVLDGEEIVKRFSPAMELEIGLTDYDFGHVENEEELKLAFWDENKPKWILFDDLELEHRDGSVVAKVWISDWSDATVGAGR